jgi:SAM-dependent methyltransferase
LTHQAAAAARRRFIDDRRQTAARRYDQVHAPTYDEEWGVISTTHESFVRKLLSQTRTRGLVLDAACGTGKYWPMILEAGRSIVGVDQSAGMLAMASSKFPAVPVGKAGLQDLTFEAAFDAAICIDVMENIAPEDWPIVIGRLSAAVRAEAPLYLTIEQLDGAELRLVYEKAVAAGHPVVEGEFYDGIGYHYYPKRNEVLGWLAGAGLEVIDQADDGDYYWHLLLRPAHP